MPVREAPVETTVAIPGAKVEEATLLLVLLCWPSYSSAVGLPPKSMAATEVLNKSPCVALSLLGEFCGALSRLTRNFVGRTL